MCGSCLCVECLPVLNLLRRRRCLVVVVYVDKLGNVVLDDLEHRARDAGTSLHDHLHMIRETSCTASTDPWAHTHTQRKIWSFIKEPKNDRACHLSHNPNPGKTVVAVQWLTSIVLAPGEKRLSIREQSSPQPRAQQFTAFAKTASVKYSKALTDKLVLCSHHPITLHALGWGVHGEGQSHLCDTKSITEISG